jgi:transcriptional regulator with XRE-family HTH domain
MSNELPNTLKKLLAENKLTARQLARETGMSISTVSDVLNGRQPSLKNLQLLSSYFDVSLDYLVNGFDSKKIKSIDELDFEDLFEGIVKIKISKIKDDGKNKKGAKK